MHRAIPCIGGPRHRELSELPPEGQPYGPTREHLGLRGHYRLHSLPEPEGGTLTVLVWEALNE
jgi:hypothetical protein